MQSSQATGVPIDNYVPSLRGPADALTAFSQMPVDVGICETWLILDGQPPFRLTPVPTEGRFPSANSSPTVVLHCCPGQWPCNRHASNEDVESIGLRVIDEIVISDGRWRSLRCADVMCCPAVGRPL
jgi:hypothetical protein